MENSFSFGVSCFVLLVVLVGYIGHHAVEICEISVVCGDYIALY